MGVLCSGVFVSAFFTGLTVLKMLGGLRFLEEVAGAGELPVLAKWEKLVSSGEGVLTGLTVDEVGVITRVLARFLEKLVWRHLIGDSEPPRGLLEVVPVDLDEESDTATFKCHLRVHGDVVITVDFIDVNLKQADPVEYAGLMEGTAFQTLKTLLQLSKTAKLILDILEKVQNSDPM